MRCHTNIISFDHPLWYRPHQICPWVAFALDHGVWSSQKSIFTIISREFFNHDNHPFFLLVTVLNFFPLDERFKTSTPGGNDNTITTLFHRRPCHLNTKGTCEVFFDLINQCIYTYLLVFIFLIIVTSLKPIFIFIFIFIMESLGSPRVLCQHV